VHVLSSFSSVGAASSAEQAFTAGMKNCTDVLHGTGRLRLTVSTEPMSVPRLGDSTSGFVVVIRGPKGDVAQRADLVIFRVDRTLVLIDLSVGMVSNPALATRLARRALAKVQGITQADAQ
jgi:hypothetical protein